MKRVTLYLLLEITLVLLSGFKSDDKPEFSPELLWEQLLEQNIDHPEVVMAQAIHETNRFKAPIFTVGNNLFAMRVPRKRETTAVGYYKSYAAYANWIDAVTDMKKWQDAHRKYYSNTAKYKSYYDFLSNY